MRPRHQLTIANVLMSLGTLPLVLVVCWVAAFFLTSVPGQPPKVPIIDPIGMVGILMTSFGFAVLVGGTAALWSWALTHANVELRSPTALAFRLATVLALIVPFLLS